MECLSLWKDKIYKFHPINLRDTFKQYFNENRDFETLPFFSWTLEWSVWMIHHKWYTTIIRCTVEAQFPLHGISRYHNIQLFGRRSLTAPLQDPQSTDWHSKAEWTFHHIWFLKVGICGRAINHMCKWNFWLHAFTT